MPRRQNSPHKKRRRECGTCKRMLQGSLNLSPFSTLFTAIISGDEEAIKAAAILHKKGQEGTLMGVVDQSFLLHFDAQTIPAIVVRAYLFLINTYKYTTREEMYLFLLISARMWMKCTYFAQKLQNLE